MRLDELEAPLESRQTRTSAAAHLVNVIFSETVVASEKINKSLQNKQFCNVMCSPRLLVRRLQSIALDRMSIDPVQPQSPA